MTKKRELKFDVNKAEQGIDTFEFKILFNENDNRYFERPFDLTNRYGQQYGSIETRDGKVFLVLNLPRFIRGKNVHPFSYQDRERLEEIYENCRESLKELFGIEVATELCKIECNITHKTMGQATTSDVLNFLCKAMLSGCKDNIKYVGPDKYCPLKEETHTTIIKKKHYWVGKFYDKSEQQRKKLIDQGKMPVGVTPNLLRIEIIMVERTLTKLFGKNKSLSDVFSEESLIKILKEYNRIFGECFSKYETQYLNGCVSKLLATLNETNSVPTTVTREREIIPDIEVLQRTLKKWHKRKQVSNNSKRDARRYEEKFQLQRDVLLTMRNFKNICG